jgi:GT2 family glycosyltransferase
LKDCLTSVFAVVETRDVEVIVVDNASSDKSDEMVENDFPSVILLKNNKNLGFSAANNQAIDVARGRYYLLLNSDTIVHGDVISDSVAYMDQNPKIGIMGCRVLNPDGSLQPTCSQFPTFLNVALLTSGLWKCPWPRFFDRYQMRRWNRMEERDVDVVTGCYMMVRSEAVRQVGLLDESFFFFGEEVDWCKRFHDAGWRTCFAPVGEITHYDGGSVRKLDYKRDLMLTGATVRLHLKHRGLLAGASVWILLLGFNTSRALFWTGLGPFSRDPKRAKARRNHFWKILWHYRQAWPTRHITEP